MNNIPQHIIKLSRKERRQLHDIIHKGMHKARTIARARILFLSDHGIGKDACAERLAVGRSTVQRIRDRYREGGITHALEEDKRPGQPRKLDRKAESYLIATACTQPPEGADHWTLELLAEKMIKDKKVKRISSVAIMHYLHRNDTKPWREKNVVYPDAHAAVH